jgi:aspartyl-tRNA(Asn)/glutamyl-tRNA(Gln) amidotransferase subunit A
MFDFRDQPVAELARRIRARELSAREVTDHALARIEALNPALNAFVAIDASRARRDAATIDQRLARGDDPGPLAGIPMGVKDLEAVEGFVTTFGSALRAGDAPATADSVHVARYRAAGAVVIGKTNTPEYGHKGATDNPLFGATTNPWSAAHSPGGSSGGSAAAIASGMVPLATGSDGGGSIRIPGALCGLSVIKTETGRIPISGTAMPGSGLLSTNGPMGWRIADSAYALDVAIGPDGGDPLSLPHPGVSWHTAVSVSKPEPPARVVWCPTFGFGTVDNEILARCQAAVNQLAAVGTEVVTLAGIWDEDPVNDWYTLWSVARYKAQGHFIGTPDFDRISESLQPQILHGAEVLGVDHARAHDAIYALNAGLEVAFAHAPIILSPVAAGQTPLLGQNGTINGQEEQGWVQFTYGINMTRNPAGSVPVGLTTAGLPVGLQVLGRHHDEIGVMRAMSAIEPAFTAKPPAG